MKYFIFDIDGTLIDSSKVDQWAMRTALAEFGYEFTYEQLIFSFGMPGRRALAKLSIPAEQVEPIMARWEALAYDRLDEIPMYDGIPRGDSRTAERRMSVRYCYLAHAPAA